jgi:putative endopeptidase
MKRSTLLKLLVSAIVALGAVSCGSHSKKGDTTERVIKINEPVVVEAKKPDVEKPDQPAEPPPIEMSMADIGLDASAMDKTANPCDDFYQYACGNWIKNTEIPSDKAGWSRSFSTIDLNNQEMLHKILEDASTAKSADPVVKKIGAFYGACMDEKAVDAQGTKPIDGLLGTVKRVKDTKSLVTAITELHRAGVSVAFALHVDQDQKDATKEIAYLFQDGLGLPDRDFYLKDDYKEQRKAYQEHLVATFGLLGMKDAAAKAAADDVIATETQLATISLTRVQRRDPQATYNKIDREGVAKSAPDFGWDAYFKALGHPEIKDISVESTAYLEGMSKLLKDVKPAAWQAYLTYHVIADYSMTLGKKWQDNMFALRQALTGQKEIEVRWKRCVRATDGALGELVAQPYIAEAFSGDSKASAETMIHAVQSAFADNLKTLSWMDDKTRTRAAEKLSKMVFKIGYPAKWKEYDFKIDPKSYAANVMASRKYELERNLKKIGKPVDRDEWGMTPPTVNAYYNPSMNEMVFPAGILQPPFYSAKNPAAVNLGAMGWVMGHEMTHGFDDQGAQFDGDGNMQNWWEPKVGEQFKARTTCVVNQYSQYVVLPKDGDQAEVKLNGELTQGENIADIGGVKFAFRAYHNMIANEEHHIVAEGFNEDQLFFLAGAQAWCSKRMPAISKQYAAVDPHSDPKWRVNGAFSDNPEFATAFQCKAGTKMAPANACTVW